MYSLAYRSAAWRVSPVLAFCRISLTFMYHDCSPGKYRGRAVVEFRLSFCSSGRPRCRLRPSPADQGPERKFSCWPCRTTAIGSLWQRRYFQLMIAGYQALSGFDRYTRRIFRIFEATRLQINKPVFCYMRKCLSTQSKRLRTSTITQELLSMYELGSFNLQSTGVHVLRSVRQLFDFTLKELPRSQLFC